VLSYFKQNKNIVLNGTAAAAAAVLGKNKIVSLINLSLSYNT
jgi:hypothetical protein